MTESRIFLTHQTASQYWAHRNIYEAPRTDCAPAGKDVPDGILIKDAIRLVIGQTGLPHISIAGKANARRIPEACLHMRTVPYPKKSFCRVASGVYVGCPELCFLQAAQILSFPALVLYGLELCGTYARRGKEFDTWYKRDPLTTAAKIRSYLARSAGASGVKAALKACDYLLDGSASPRESELLLLERFPSLKGGFGAAAPRLNYGIKVNAPDPRHPGKQLELHGDIVWPEAKLIVEYDGPQHGLEDNHSSDKQRDHLFLDAGYDVIRFTDERIKNLEELQRLAKTIAKRSGKRVRKSSLELDDRKRALHHAVLHECDLPWLE